MSTPGLRSWQDVQAEVLRRIHARQWKPGEMIPNEADLAQEFGCARATVNRALRTLAEAGWLDRRRKAGTRVALRPVAKATLSIPVIRQEIEDKGLDYGYALLSRRVGPPPGDVAQAMRVADSAALLHLRARHLGDGRAYAIEDRWINSDHVPAALEEPFERVSGNEWLLQHAPFTHGEIGFAAEAAGKGAARDLGCAQGSALFVMDRLTWDGDAAVTRVRLFYAPGHRMQTVL